MVIWNERRGRRRNCSIQCSNENMWEMRMTGMGIKGEGACTGVWNTGPMHAVGRATWQGWQQVEWKMSLSVTEPYPYVFLQLPRLSFFFFLFTLLLTSPLSHCHANVQRCIFSSAKSVQQTEPGMEEESKMAGLYHTVGVGIGGNWWDRPCEFNLD